MAFVDLLVFESGDPFAIKVIVQVTEKSSTDIWAVEAREDMESLYTRRRSHEKKKVRLKKASHSCSYIVK